MTSYDFNATYGPLRVYNQENEGACVIYAIDTCVAGQVLMHTDHLPVWPDDGASYPKLVQGGFQPDGTYIDYYITMENTQYAVRAEESSSDMSPDHLKQLLLSSGIVTLGVDRVASFTNPPQTPGLPVIQPLSTDSSGGGHDTVAVGFTDKGVICQNSYGLPWGYRGRAVLSWNWLALHGTDTQRYQIDSYPLDGMTKSPQPLKEDKVLLLAQRTNASPVFVFLGGQRSWLPNWTVGNAQGFFKEDLKVIPDDGSATSIWRLPMTGKLPPADN